MEMVHVGRWLREVSLVTAAVLAGTLGWSLACMISPSVWNALANIPNDTVGHWQLYRILTAPYLCPAPLSLLIQLLFFASLAQKAEKAAGSLAYFTHLQANSDL